MNEPKVLDLSRIVCHVCGQQLLKNIEDRTERCTYHACLIRNIDFTIPFVETKEAKA